MDSTIYPSEHTTKITDSLTVREMKQIGKGNPKRFKNSSVAVAKDQRVCGMPPLLCLSRLMIKKYIYIYITCMNVNVDY